MVAELIIAKTPNQQSAPLVHVHVEPERWSRLRHLFLFLKIAVALLVIATAVAGYLTYTSYKAFAELVDRQIAGGYLRGHAGLYASPRVIEKGARLSKEELVVSLQKAGYVSGLTSNVWSGSFSQTGESIRLSPQQQTEPYEWIDISFDKQHHIASLVTSDGSELPSYSLEPQLLTDDAGLKIGEQRTLTYKDLPPVLVNAILAIEDRRLLSA